MAIPTINEFAVAYRLVGELNVHALVQSFEEIVRRHPTLQTTSFPKDGMRIREPRSPTQFPLVIVDNFDHPEGKGEKMLSDLLRTEAAQPFDFEDGPLIRAKLLRLGEREHLLILRLHPNVCDDRSTEVFFRELSILYEAYQLGQRGLLDVLTTSYDDYFRRQPASMNSERLASHISYWRTQLDNLSTLQLPSDRPRPVTQTFRDAKRTVTFSAGLADALNAFSRNEGVTLFMTLLAAFQTLLHRYTGQEDIAVGTLIANRDRPEFDRIIGYFSNTLVLRTDGSGNPTFREYLKRVQLSCLGGYEHRVIPFGQLVEHLHPERSVDPNPLFHAAFQLDNGQKYLLRLPGITIEAMALEAVTIEVDLSVSVIDEGLGLTAHFRYNSDVLDVSTIERLIGHFENLLRAIVADPNQRLGSLPMLTQQEQHQSLVEWNNTGREYSADRCVHRLFEDQAAKTPDAVAVEFGAEKLSYAELHKRANQLARYLRKFGVRRNSLVAIAVDPSIEMMVGVLGVLKAGAAFVPLDPNYPQERLNFLLADTKTSVLLTQERFQNDTVVDREQQLLGHIGNQGVKTLRLDRDWSEIGQESQDNIETETTPGDLAYVIYTSGSTGKPKGVMVSHGALAQHICSAVEHYEIRSDDRVLQFASLTFDVAVEEMFPAWMSGAMVVLLPERLPVIADFVAYLGMYRISVVNLPSAYWQQWVDDIDQLDKQLPSSLRLVIVGNEKVSLVHLRRWQRTFGSKVRWLNAYGPTEAVITATLYEAPQSDDSYGQLKSVPIGRPMTNRQVYLLGSNAQPVPIGAVGEIYLGGPALALGYLNNPEMTAEKFVRNPFHRDPKSRLYRTGDMGRYRTDGLIEFVGRADDQVKIRGFRIELGEIENQLLSHPAVRAAAVLVHDADGDDPQLIAYAVPRTKGVSDGKPSIGEQRINQAGGGRRNEFNQRLFTDGAPARVAPVDLKINDKDLAVYLRTRLPHYMVPSTIVVLDALPVTTNGKVDRKALPKPQRARAANNGNDIAPCNFVEAKLAAIWCEVLKIEKVGVRENFFDLGGHSLLALRLANLIRRRCQMPFRLADVFEAPTVEQQARLLEAGSESSWSSLVALNRQGSRRPFFWVHGEASDAYLPRYLGADQPLYGIRHQSEDGQPARYRTVEEIASHYLEEIRSVQPQGPYILGGYCFGGLVTMEMAKQLRAQGESVDLLVLINPPFDPVPGLGNNPQDIGSGTLWLGLRRNLYALGSLSPHEKLGYVLKRVRGKIAEAVSFAWAPTKRFAQRFIWEMCERIGAALPVFVRSPYILNIYQEAIRKYRPQPYQGRVLLFVTNDDLLNFELKWFNRDESMVTMFEAPGDHRSILQEPDVQFWATRLKSCLEDAQQGTKASRPGRSQRRVRPVYLLPAVEDLTLPIYNFVEWVMVGQMSVLVV